VVPVNGQQPPTDWSDAQCGHAIERLEREIAELRVWCRGLEQQQAQLAVMPRSVVDAADGWVAAECGVGAVIVVGVQPAVKRRAAVAVGLIRLGVGPFFEQGAVEPFDLAVGLWPVGRVNRWTAPRLAMVAAKVRLLR
jgi:hypothetical protein